MAILSTSCGGGGSTALAPISTAGVSLSSTALVFSKQPVATTSAAQTVIITNTGGPALKISGIAASGDFAQTNNCGTNMAVGINCTVNVVFTPTEEGTRSGSLSISDNVTGSPNTVSLTGTGVATAPAVSLAPTGLSFSSQGVGTISNARTVTLTNSGSATLSITGITVSGVNASDFAQTDSCATSIATKTTCSISVTFKPSASGSRAAALAVADNATGSPQTVSLAGTGTNTTPAAAAAPAVSLSPTSLAFGSEPVHSTSAARTVTLTNSGSAPLSITGIAVSGTNASDFAQTNNCGSSVATNAVCTFSVTFKPSASGARAATLSITNNTAGSPQTVAVTGSGTNSAAAAASLSPTSLAFGNQPVQTASTARTVTLTNTGNTTLSITNLAFTGANASDFAEADTCGSSLAAGANCTIAIMFTPSAVGARTAALSISDNSGSGPHTVALSGAGIHSVVLSWTPGGTADVTGYNVYRGTTSGGESSTPLNSTPISGTTFRDENVVPGATYYYLVAATVSNQGTLTAASNEAVVTIPAP